VRSEPGADQLNEFQLQQKVAMKMQAHMAQNMPQMMMPSSEQQRSIQLQMLAHMKKNFANEPDLCTRIGDLEGKLKENSLTPIEANMQMRQLQQELMARQMQKMQLQMQEQKQPTKEKNEEEEVPMRNMAD
jgi:hypothetical protein